MSSTLSWQLPSLDPHLAARRYLLRRRDCLAPIRTAAFQHPDLGPMIRALLAFATDGILLAEERRTARPLVHLAFDEAWQLYTPQREHDDAHGPMWPRPILPLETYLVILPVAYLAREMAGLRLRCGEAFWSPQTGAPLQDWLRRQHGQVVLHSMAADARTTITVEVAALQPCRARAPASSARQQTAGGAADSRPYRRDRSRMVKQSNVSEYEAERTATT